MKYQVRAVFALVAVALAVGVGAAGCAARQKQIAVVGYDSVQTALEVFQDAEIALYRAKTLPELDATRHAAIQTALKQAFDAQVKVGDALLLWRSGEPAPVGVSEWLTEAERVVTEVERLVPGNARVQLVASLVRWARGIVAIASQLRVAPPANVARLAAEGGV